MTKIDSHQHFWKYDPEEFGWISDDMSVIRRDFLPANLLAEIKSAGIDGVVSVQARQSIDETDQLIHFAKHNEFIKGIVGWLPLCDANIERYLEQYSQAGGLKGLRHVVQDEPDDEFILRDDFNRGISLLKNFGLVYDILIFEKHLPAAVEFVKKHPDQQFVLDHIAKPKIKAGLIQPWRKNIERLAEFKNVCCKLSGMVIEADLKTWTPGRLKPYFDIVLDAFGPERLMFGSDWPVCLCACGYKTWVETVAEFITCLSPTRQDAIMGRTAARFYNLEIEQ